MHPPVRPSSRIAANGGLESQDSNESFMLLTSSAVASRGWSAMHDTARSSELAYVTVKPGAAVTAGNVAVFGVYGEDVVSADLNALGPPIIAGREIKIHTVGPVPRLLTVTGIVVGDILVCAGTANTWVKYVAGTHTNPGLKVAIATSASAETSTGSGIYVCSAILK